MIRRPDGWRSIAALALIIAALTAATACDSGSETGLERDLDSGGVEGTVDAAPVAEGGNAAAPPVAFDELRVPSTPTRGPAALDLTSHPRAREYRTALERGVTEGPNFAGHYVVVEWGCGTACQEFMIVDARNGEVYEGRTSAVGLEYRLDSSLLIVNPPDRGAAAGCSSTTCVAQYLVWNGDRLEAYAREDDREAIRRATVEYVRRETQIREVSVEIAAIADGWARVRVAPEGEVTDPATLYLRKIGDVWEGVVLGTGFTPDDLDRLGVPATVRPSFM